jgi:hypothetical protein
VVAGSDEDARLSLFLLLVCEDLVCEMVLVNFFKSGIPVLQQALRLQPVEVFCASDFFLMVWSGAKDGVKMVQRSRAVSKVCAHQRMENEDVICIVDRSPDMELVKVGHSHDDDSGVQEGESEWKKLIQVERYDVCLPLVENWIFRIGGDVTENSSSTDQIADDPLKVGNILGSGRIENNLLKSCFGFPE